MFVVGLAILAKRFKNINRAICIYAFFMFFVGFVVMAGQGGSLALLEAIDIEELERTCQATPA